MTLSAEETNKLKAMFLYLVQKRHKESNGHCGFHLTELQPVLDQLATDGSIVKRPSINIDNYFLNPNTSNKDETKAHPTKIGN